ncbi:MAG: hypothetical protein JSS86_17290, partial [Cyanobacteria bacterium SZAS LIN-2]|nr:hypothetical protein [Cyanobacteria bacterium SZAS LIN-2]
MHNRDLRRGGTLPAGARRVGVACGLAGSLGLNTITVLAASPALPPGHIPWSAPTSFAGHTPFHSNVAASGSATHAAATSFNQGWQQHQSPAAFAGQSHGLIHAAAVGTGLIGTQDLNLASSQANIPAASLAGFHELTILVGGTRQVIGLDSKLTGAEAIAAQQVLSGGNQTIKIAADGHATGGQVILSNAMMSAIDSALGGTINTLTV